MEDLPQPPRWLATEVTIEGGTTKDPIILYYRDGLECFKYLFSHPIFQGCMDFAPQHHWDSEERSTRLYSDIMTGDFVWDIQVRFYLL